MLKKVDKIKTASKENTDESIPSVFQMMSATNMAEVLSTMTTGMDIFSIELEKLKEAPSDWNFYSPLSEKKMEELVESIKSNGLLHPLVVWEQADGNYIVLSGHNRVRAFKILLKQTNEEKYKKIYCFVKKKDEISEEDAKEIIIDTNWVQRELSTIEKAQSIYRKYTALGRKQKVKHGEGNGLRNYDIIAEQFDISGRHVLRYYKLNFLIDEFQKLIETNNISISAGLKVADFHPLTQKWIYDTFKTKINSKNLIKINSKMDRTEIERTFNQEGLSEEKIEVKYIIPFRLKAEFDLYVEEFFKKNLVT